MKPFSIKNLLILDFLCALGGGVLYLFLFDYLWQMLGLPYWLVLVQTGANFFYALVGFSIFLGGAGRLHFFKYLITMNFIYAVFCLIMGASILIDQFSLSALVLISEGVLILLLAIAEKQSFKQKYP